MSNYFCIMGYGKNLSWNVICNECWTINPNEPPFCTATPFCERDIQISKIDNRDRDVVVVDGGLQVTILVEMRMPTVYT